MNETIIKTKELPLDVRALLADYGFTKNTVTVKPTIDFTCPTNWHDANIMRLVVFNQETGEHKCQTSGYYECHMNFDKAEKAMYLGELKSSIPGPHIWFLLLESYPKSCTVFCHPTAIAGAITGPKVELTRKQQICLYITRSLISAARLEEARRFKITKSEWETLKAELFGLKLMTAAGALTLEGKNVSKEFNFNAWEEK